MPELPDVTIYVERLTARYAGQVIEAARLTSPFLLRSVEPPLGAVVGKTVRGFSRLGKRVIWELDDELFLVFHLMIAGRFHEKPRGQKLAQKVGLVAFDFAARSLVLTEASTKKRASLHVVRGRAGLEAFRRGGIDVFGATASFAEALRRENHTLKRSLTDPDLFDGIGNAYSDEILHRARLSPLKLTSRLDDAEIARLHQATKETLTLWIDKLRAEVGDGFPEKVTAFREGMAVHGRYKEPCPDCGSPVQRISYAENECNYCAKCQTVGRLLADRSLSRLMKDDWPKTLDELEQKKAAMKK